MKKMVLSGGSGYLGSLLLNRFIDEYQINILSRNSRAPKGNIQYIKWDGKTGGDWEKVLEGADVLINLAGKNINVRFTEQNKKEILQSRIDSTLALGRAVNSCENPPKMWLNASAVAIYEESFAGTERDESSLPLGESFLSEVSRAWEAAFYEFPSEETVKTVFRISLILGESEGSALQTLKTLVKLGGGGAAGSGEQMVSWMSEPDFVSAIAFLIENQLEGRFNFCGPKAISNKQLMAELREKYNMPIGLPAPEFLVKMGASVIGTAPELILRSQNVIPKRLLEKGYEFKVTEIKDIP